MSTNYTVPILEKTFAIIKHISEQEEGSTFSELVNSSLNIPKSTIFKILQTLETDGWIERRNARYILGNKMIHYGLRSLAKKDLRSVANPYLYRLMMRTGETSHLAVQAGQQSMLIDVCMTTHPIKFASPVGSMFPLYCTSHGKIFLAYATNQPISMQIDVTIMKRRTQRTITTIEAMESEITKIREQGYAIDDMEMIDDIRCCAAPIRDASGLCIGAVGITSTTLTFPESRIQEIAEVVKEIAEQISQEMGFQRNS